MPKKRYRIIAVSISLIFFGLLWLSYWFAVTREQTVVAFLSVGEGDAILISQGTNQILIDGGRSGKDLLYRLGRHIPFWDRQIETVIETHPDADHIGGLAALVRAYRVKNVLYSGAESDTEVSELLRTALAEAGLVPEKVFRGTELEFPSGGRLVVEYPLTPLPRDSKETNSGSVVTRFVYGTTSFLLTGDLPAEETALPNETPATVLKAAHHGSRYSTSDAWLDLIRPSEAVISVGENSYGHPSPDTLSRLQKRGIRVSRTDKEGDIAYWCVRDTCVKE